MLWAVLEVGNGECSGSLAAPSLAHSPQQRRCCAGMTAAQDRAHFTIWSIMASPLIAGNDLRKMSQDTIQILTNKHAIAVNQDPL